LTFHWGRAISTFLVSTLDTLLGTSEAGDDAAADAAARNPGSTAMGAASNIPGPVGDAAGTTKAVGDALVAGGGHYVNEADEDLRNFEDAQDPGDNTHPDPAVVNAACSAGSTSKFCGAWHLAHDQANAGSNGANNGGGNASDPGPDQQNDDPDAAMLQRSLVSVKRTSSTANE